MRTATLALVLLIASPVAAETLTDPTGVVSVEVPGEWTVREGDDYYNELESWRGRLDLGGSPVTATLLIQRRPRYSRAQLALELPYFATDEIFMDEEARSGESFAEVATRPQQDGVDRPWLEWRRGVEANSMVYVVSLYISHLDAAAVRDAVRPILDSVTVREGADTPFQEVRSGWWTKEVDGYVVVSDVKQKARAQAIARKAAIGRKIVAGALGGEPHDAAKPIIWAFADSVAYEAFVTNHGGNPRLQAEYVMQARVLAVELAREENDDADAAYWDVIRRQAAYQYTCQYFGGASPTWVGTGLAYYGAIGAESGGKGDKPRTWYVDKGREVVAGIPSLEGTLRLRWEEVDDVTRVGYELWAWHFFFRHARAAKSERKLYDAYITTLRETGSPRRAEKAFEGVDYAALRAALRKFSDKWR